MSTANSNLDPYNRGGMWAFVFSMAFSVIFFIWVSFFQGIDLREIPEEAQAAMAAAKADQANKEGSNAAESGAAGAVAVSDDSAPWVSSDAMIVKGQAAYKANCAVCHGDTGKGDGPAGMAIGARNLVEGKWKVGGDTLSLFKTLAEGVAGTAMAAFPQIPVNDRWAIVHYVRSITNNKGKDDPKAIEEFAKTAK